MKNSSKDFISRLKYLKQVNYREIRDKMQKKIDANKNRGQNIETNEKEEENKDYESNY